MTTSLVVAGAVWAGTALAGTSGPAAPTSAAGRTAPAGPTGSAQPPNNSSLPLTGSDLAGPDDKPAFPEFTTKTPNGYLVNTCVPEALYGNVISLRTSDGVRLSAIALGSGGKGIVLGHEQGYNICSFLALGQSLADRGYNVVVFEFRNHGASGTSEDNDHLDRDTMAGVDEVTRRGATRILTAGASCGGSSSVVVAPSIPGFAGLIVMSSPRVCGTLSAVEVVKSIKQPSLFAFSPGDMGFEEEVRGLYEASGAKDKRLVIVPGGVHGTDMLRLPDEGPKLTATLLAFVDDAFRAAG